ncbi:hypothetical protein CEXT_424251 [Caerostris extrusa]|uniref:Uncharacterized protein n=1 Tax=Caerostris extrusa TaxID=172846 RepID=A0AAV4NXS5_CAEEX|nr:hypothetical protein CEXT_424251 [Caerostris extrusa]
MGGGGGDETNERENILWIERINTHIRGRLNVFDWLHKPLSSKIYTKGKVYFVPQDHCRGVSTIAKAKLMYVTRLAKIRKCINAGNRNGQLISGIVSLCV